MKNLPNSLKKTAWAVDASGLERPPASGIRAPKPRFIKAMRYSGPLPVAKRRQHSSDPDSRLETGGEFRGKPEIGRRAGIRLRP